MIIVHTTILQQQQMTVSQCDMTFRSLPNMTHTGTKNARPVWLKKATILSRPTCCRYNSVCTTQAVSVSADVLYMQVVQDVNGRFVASVAMQLRKRAANLCYQELKEYKVCTPNAKAEALAGCDASVTVSACRDLRSSTSLRSQQRQTPLEVNHQRLAISYLLCLMMNLQQAPQSPLKGAFHVADTLQHLSKAIKLQLTLDQMYFQEHQCINSRQPLHHPLKVLWCHPFQHPLNRP